MDGTPGKKEADQPVNWKGKAKAVDSNPASDSSRNDEAASNSQSLTSRIAGSASGLTKILFSAQAARSATSELASSAAAVGEKAARVGPSSSSSESQWMLNSTLKPAAETSKEKSSVHERQGFREIRGVDGSSLDQTAADAFREFQNPRVFFEDPSVASFHEQDNVSESDRAKVWSSSFARMHGADILDETERSSRESTVPSLNDVQLQERTDGADVIALLDPENEESNLEEELQTTHNAFEFQLKEPDPAVFPGASKAAETEGLSTGPSASLEKPGSIARLWPDLIPEDASEEMVQQQLNEWHHALSNYTDFVWGSQDPFGKEVPQVVQDARREIENMKEQDQYSDKQAVRRLNMVLRHLK